MKLGTDSAPDVVIAPGAGVAQSGVILSTGSTDTRVFELGGYVRALAGYGPVDYRLCLWGWGGGVGSPNRLLGQTAVHSVNAAALAPANLRRVTWLLEDPVELAAWSDVLVGVAWETDPTLQLLLGGYSGTGDRYRKDLDAGAGWPVSMKDSIHLTDHNAAGWIEDFEPSSGVWVYRSGAWTPADGVLVRRAGFWEVADVSVRRSGVWTDVSS